MIRVNKEFLVRARNPMISGTRRCKMTNSLHPSARMRMIEGSLCMRKFKIILALIILGCIAVFVAQNEAFFKTTNSFRIKIPMMEEYQTPLVMNWQLFTGAFIVGGVLMFLASLPGRMKTRKTLKELNATIQTNQDKISSLENDAPKPGLTSAESAAATVVPEKEGEATASAQAG